MRQGFGRRLLWLAVYWGAGVAAVALLAMLIRAVLPY